MKTLVYIIALVFLAAMFCSCAGSGSKFTHGSCQANKTNNHKSTRTFLY